MMDFLHQEKLLLHCLFERLEWNGLQTVSFANNFNLSAAYLQQQLIVEGKGRER